MKTSTLALLCVMPFFAIGPGFSQTATPPPMTGSGETVKVQAGSIPDEAVTGFVQTFTEPSLVSGKIPRWFSGICLKTQGLPKELSDAVTKRILDVAEMVGAPVQDQPCPLNAVVIFAANPQAVMDDIAANHQDLLGAHDPAQTKTLAQVHFPVQAWYATETQDNNGQVVADNHTQSDLCGTTDDNYIISTDLKNGPKIDVGKYATAINNKRRDCGQRVVTGSRIRDGIRSRLAAVTVVAAMETVQYHELAAVADYLALVILSQTKAFENCEKMETVANLLVPRCDLNNRVKGLMPGDLAYLKALYRADTGGTLVMQQASITGEMKKLLAAEK